jgi:hypothetical protein
MSKRGSNRDGLLRVLIYPVQFEADPIDGIDRVINEIIPNMNAVSKSSEDYLNAIESGLESSDELSLLLPQTHSEKVIRRYLREVRRRLKS